MANSLYNVNAFGQPIAIFQQELEDTIVYKETSDKITIYSEMGRKVTPEKYSIHNSLKFKATIIFEGITSTDLFLNFLVARGTWIRDLALSAIKTLTVILENNNSRKNVKRLLSLVPSRFKIQISTSTYFSNLFLSPTDKLMEIEGFIEFRILDKKNWKDGIGDLITPAIAAGIYLKIEAVDQFLLNMILERLTMTSENFKKIFKEYKEDLNGIASIFNEIYNRSSMDIDTQNKIKLYQNSVQFMSDSLDKFESMVHLETTEREILKQHLPIVLTNIIADYVFSNSMIIE